MSVPEVVVKTRLNADGWFDWSIQRGDTEVKGIINIREVTDVTYSSGTLLLNSLGTDAPFRISASCEKGGNRLYAALRRACRKIAKEGGR